MFFSLASHSRKGKHIHDLMGRPEKLRVDGRKILKGILKK
jgi:hypothetical protein